MKVIFKKESIELDSVYLEAIFDDIVSDVADDREAFYLEVAKYGTRRMRSILANLSPMPESIFNALVENADSDLLGLLIENEEAAAYMTQEMIDNFVNSDDNNVLISFIANEQNLRHLEGIDEKLEQLARHPDAGIRFAVAFNFDIPRYVLALLLEDSDERVAQWAFKNLKNRDQVDE